MATTPVVPWAELLSSSEPANPLVPSIELLLIGREGRTWKANFLVDSGADISLAPRALCERLGLVGDAGQPMLLNGISERPECAVPARIFEVELLIPDLAIALDIPICFAEGNASLILGREGFFDCFRIEFDKANFVTRFTLVEDELVEDE